MEPVIVVMTGNAGSGKTFISKIFTSLFKVPVFNIDAAAKSVVNESSEVIEKLKELYW